MVLVRDLDVERAVPLDGERVARLLLHPGLGVLESVLTSTADAGHDLGRAGGERELGVWAEDDAHGLVIGQNDVSFPLLSHRSGRACAERERARGVR